MTLGIFEFEQFLPDEYSKAILNFQQKQNIAYFNNENKKNIIFEKYNEDDKETFFKKCDTIIIYFNLAQEAILLSHLSLLGTTNTSIILLSENNLSYFTAKKLEIFIQEAKIKICFLLLNSYNFLFNYIDIDNEEVLFIKIRKESKIPIKVLDIDKNIYFLYHWFYKNNINKVYTNINKNLYSLFQIHFSNHTNAIIESNTISIENIYSLSIITNKCNYLIQIKDNIISIYTQKAINEKLQLINKIKKPLQNVIFFNELDNFINNNKTVSNISIFDSKQIALWKEKIFENTSI